MTTIPCLYIDKEHCFVGSQTIVDYLDKEFSSPNLQSTAHKEILTEFGNISANFYKCIKNSNLEDEANMLKGLDYLEATLNDVYFGGFLYRYFYFNTVLALYTQYTLEVYVCPFTLILSNGLI